MNIDEMVQGGKIVILDFYAEWCGPCKALAPILEQIVEENEDVDLVKINIEEEMEMAKEYSVRSVPTLHFISQNGKESKVGTMPEQDIVAIIDFLR